MRRLLPILAVLAALGLIAGCGGGEKAADSGTDVDRLLDETFAGAKDIRSGKLDLGVRVESAGQPGSLSVSGPFEVEDENTLPLVALAASVQFGGQGLDAGVVNTGDAGFVRFQGNDYEVSAPVYRQFKAGYEETAKQTAGRSPATLGLDARRWLTNARNAGESEVGGTETIRITGGVDVPRLLDDVNAALQRLRGLGVRGAQDLPEQLSDAQKRQIADAVRDVSVEIHTGADDRILRRVLVALTVAPPGGGDPTRVRLDLSLLEVNEDQEIEAPEDPRPFSELADRLGGLGMALGGSSAGGAGAADRQALRRYSECIEDAGGDDAAVRRCAESLRP